MLSSLILSLTCCVAAGAVSGIALSFLPSKGFTKSVVETNAACCVDVGVARKGIIGIGGGRSSRDRRLGVIACGH